jgi:hypothetical protein
MKIDWTIFDWEEIFGTVVSTEGFKRAQTRGIRAEIIELAIEKYSKKQLKYVGVNDKLGHDFVTTSIGDLVRLECKCQDKLFQPKANKTKQIILKNFAGRTIDKLDQKYDYMLMIDTAKMKAGYASFDATMKQHKINDANVTIQVYHDDITWVCSDIVPKPKPDLVAALNTLIKDLI